MDIKKEITKVSEQMAVIYGELTHNMLEYVNSKDADAIVKDASYCKVRNVEKFLMDSYMALLQCKIELGTITAEENNFMDVVYAQEDNNCF